MKMKKQSIQSCSKIEFVKPIYYKFIFFYGIDSTGELCYNDSAFLMEKSECSERTNTRATKAGNSRIRERESAKGKSCAKPYVSIRMNRRKMLQLLWMMRIGKMP